MSQLSASDRVFINELAWKIALQHGRRAMRVPPARAELAKDIAEAIRGLRGN